MTYTIFVVDVDVGVDVDVDVDVQLIYSQCLKVQSSSGQLPIGSKVYKLPKIKR